MEAVDGHAAIILDDNKGYKATISACQYHCETHVDQCEGFVYNQNLQECRFRGGLIRHRFQSSSDWDTWIRPRDSCIFDAL